MMQFAEFFPDEAIVSALSTQLSWSHFVEMLPINDPLKREFYAEMCCIERWSVRTLRQKIERTVSIIRWKQTERFFSLSYANAPRVI